MNRAIVASVAAVGVLAPAAVAVDSASHSNDGVPTPIVRQWSDLDREFVLQSFGEKPRRWRVRTCELYRGESWREYMRARGRTERAVKEAAPVLRQWDGEERRAFVAFAATRVYAHCTR